MSMTREEAIDILENEKMCVNNETCQREECATCSLVMDKDKILTALDMALSALRPVSRERVEKVWRGEWITPTIIGGRAYNIPHCSACNGVPCGTDEHTRFCAHCGAPMTDEAVEMVMERLEALKDGKGD
jgi:hypothetical protein